MPSCGLSSETGVGDGNVSGVVSDDRPLNKILDGGPEPRVLILADERGRGIASRLCCGALPNYKVEIIFKPNADLMGVVCDCARLARGYGDNDYVIVLAGTDNVSHNSKKINVRELSVKLQCMSFTNLMFISQPFVNNNNNVNNKISKFNMTSYKICQLLCQNITFADVNCIMESRDMHKHGMRMTWSGKTKLCNYICELLSYLNAKKPNQTLLTGSETTHLRKNLIYITASDTHK